MAYARSKYFLGAMYIHTHKFSCIDTLVPGPARASLLRRRPDGAQMAHRRRSDGGPTADRRRTDGAPAAARRRSDVFFAVGNAPGESAKLVIIKLTVKLRGWNLKCPTLDLILTAMTYARSKYFLGAMYIHTHKFSCIDMIPSFPGLRVHLYSDGGPTAHRWCSAELRRIFRRRECPSPPP